MPDQPVPSAPSEAVMTHTCARVVDADDGRLAVCGAPMPCHVHSNAALPPHPRSPHCTSTCVEDLQTELDLDAEGR